MDQLAYSTYSVQNALHVQAVSQLDGVPLHGSSLNSTGAHLQHYFLAWYKACTARQIKQDFTLGGQLTIVPRGQMPVMFPCLCCYCKPLAAAAGTIMSKRWTQKELEAFLVNLDPEYIKYARVLSGRSREQLANADKEDLVAYGITDRLHATDIIVRAGKTGQFFAAMV